MIGGSDTLDGGVSDSMLDRLRNLYRSRRIGDRVGFGTRPALLVVDMQYGFTDPAYPLGADVPAAIEQANRLARTARQYHLPVIFTAAVWAEVAEVWARKLPGQRGLIDGTRQTEIDERVAPQAGETVLKKNFASGFCRTDLNERLRSLRVDTIIVCGVTTSGCVRAAAVDGISLGYRIIVAEDACADRALEPHVMSLFDIDAKYGDVMTTNEIAAQLGTVLDPHS